MVVPANHIRQIAMPHSARTAATDRLAQDAADLQAALARLLRVYQFRDRDRICCHDVSVTQCHALELLVERGAMRSQALSDALLLDKSTTTRVVDALVRKGYAERSPDLEDRRAVRLRATTAGRRLVQRINDDLVAQQRALLADLPAEVRRGTIETLDRLAGLAERRFLDAGGCGPGACAPSEGRRPGCA